MTGWLLALIALVYVGVLFTVAWFGDRSGAAWREHWRPLIYSLSLAVYCTSWTFFGAVGQASENPWSFLPIYLGPILMFVLFWKLLAKLILVSKKENITSIADFIASRHGKSRALATLVTLILIAGILPYIALQLKAIVMGFDLLSEGQSEQWNRQDLALIVTVTLAVFVVVFGTRHLYTTEHQHGVMTAIAFESLLKLAAFLLVGAWVTWQFLSDSWPVNVSLPERSPSGGLLETMVVPTLMAMAAIICLPRQFHVIVVENASMKDFHRARWLFPAYLVLASLFVLPMALAGNSLLGNSTSPDSYVIALPLALGNDGMALLAYMGGVSAAISMVIVATIALSTMISNEILMPLLLRKSRDNSVDFYRFSGLLLNVRRTTILCLLLMAYVVFRLIDNSGSGSLAGLGQMSFAAVAQLAPAVIGGLYLKESNSKAVGLGLVAGSGIWFYTLMLPLMINAGWLKSDLLLHGLFGIEALKPGALFGFEMTGTVVGASVLSFSVNLILYSLGCLYFKVDSAERRQSRRFVDASWEDSSQYREEKVALEDLQTLAKRFLGENRTARLMEQFAPSGRYADSDLISATERHLAGVMGASSAKVVMKSALAGDTVQLEDVEAMVDEAHEVFRFNRELLRGAIEHISQGISVVDRDLRLVAWNRRYLELFSYPDDLIRVGRPVSEIIRHNAVNGLCGPGDPEEHVLKRVQFMREGTAHKSERVRPDGRVIEMRGNPMPGGGFAMSFTDITEFRDVEHALQDINESLEQRVQERTRELFDLNRELMRAKGQADRANRLRSRFFTAVSHDLMQPMNAARLFAASLESSVTDAQNQELIRHLGSSLKAAEELLKDLLDMSRLEAGQLIAEVREFPLSELLDPLKTEFERLAGEEGQVFRLVGSKLWVRSDPVLLRRILQNFLTNALRYCRTDGGRVMLGCRRRGNTLVVEVRDNGQGIPVEKQELVFAEFQRFHTDGKGLGLGLAIARGVAELLGHSLSVRSRPGAGTVFTVSLPVVQPRVIKRQLEVQSDTSLAGLNAFCIDNEAEILLGMNRLLTRWGCQVACADSCQKTMELLGNGDAPDILLVDYRLDEEETGLELIERIRMKCDRLIPAILITADRQDSLQIQCREADIRFLGKPVKPAALRALISSLVTKPERLS
ncbi:MAG: hybrid sensor histidine kinase/response regulator [Endozoicomonas sp.]|uniref:hybrid sensor histidine kinase/response regulator n=1 Tax=Endozoicomonas sp. TaxID=1892382 RepID=UPI003D9B7DD9